MRLSIANTNIYLATRTIGLVISVIYLDIMSTIILIVGANNILSNLSVNGIVLAYILVSLPILLIIGKFFYKVSWKDERYKIYFEKYGNETPQEHIRRRNRCIAIVVLLTLYLISSILLIFN